MAQRSLTVKVVGDAASFEKAIRKSIAANKDLDKSFSVTATAGSAFSKSMMFAAGSLLGGAGFVGAATKAVNAASDLEEQIAKTNVVFGKGAKDVQEWSKTTASSLGIAQDKALEATGVFGNMLVPMGFAREKAADMSVTMVKLAADMASFNNASPEETLDALRAGLAGETEPLRRFGVFLNDAAVKQEALNMGLYTGKGNLDAAGKAAATYSIILKQTKDAQGDVERTGDSFANQQRKLSALIRDTEASIGKALLPTVTKITSALTGWLSKTENQQKIQDAANKTIRVAGDIVDAVWPKLQQMGKAADGVAQAVGGWGNALGIITGGLLLNRVSSLAGAFGGRTGLAGNVFAATQSVAGKGGLLAALRAIPPVIGVAVVVSSLVPKGLRVAGQDILEKGGLGGVGNVPVLGPLAQAAAAGGQWIGRAAGIDYTDTGGYKVGSAEHSAYMRGLSNESLTSSDLDNPAAANAYAAGRRKAGTNRVVAPKVTRLGTQNIAPAAATNYSMGSGGFGVGSSGGGGGGRSSAAKDAAKEAAARAAQDALMGRLLVQGIRLFPGDQAGPMSGSNADTIAADRARAEATVKARIDAIARATAAARPALAGAFTKLGDAALKAFDSKTAEMQKGLASKLSGLLAEIEKARVELTPAERELQQLQDARAEQERADALTAAQASGDAKAIADAQYAIRIAALQRQASAERAARDQEARTRAAAAQQAYQDESDALTQQRQLERDAYSDKLTALNEYLTERAKSVSDANQRIRGDLGSFVTGLDAQLADVLNKLAALRAAQTGAVLPSAGSTLATLPTGQQFYYPMATGGDFLVNEPTLFLAGEAGPERATFSPLGGRNHHGTGTTVIVNVAGNVTSERDLAATIRGELIRGGISGASTSVVARTRTGV